MELTFHGEFQYRFCNPSPAKTHPAPVPVDPGEYTSRGLTSRPVAALREFIRSVSYHDIGVAAFA